MAAAGDDHQAPVADVHDHRLVVEDERVRLPPLAAPCLLDGEPRLVSGGPVHLAGDQDRVLEQEAGLPLLDDLEAGALQRTAARRGNLDRLAAGQQHAPPVPEVRVDQDGQVGPPEPADQAVETGRVVEVAVAQHDGLHVVGIDLQPAHVLHHPVRTDAAVEEQPVRPVALVRVRSSEKPCSATSWSGTKPFAIVASGRRPLVDPGPLRRASPWSGINTS